MRTLFRNTHKSVPPIWWIRSRTRADSTIDTHGIEAGSENGRSAWSPAGFNVMRISLRQLGVVALAVSVAMIIVGVATYGNEMWPHFMAEAVGIFGETALVILVLDRMSSSESRREWRFVSTAAGHRMAACMTDVMRLCCVRWNQAAYRGNISRYDEFNRIAKLHLNDLRSILVALALGSEPSGYEQARRIELRLAWLVDYLCGVPGKPEIPGPEYPVVVNTVKAIGEFLRSAANPEFSSDASTANSIVAQLGGTKDPANSSKDAQEFVVLRLAAQDELLRIKSVKGVPARGIFYDIDQELAHGYFAIDYILLSNFDEATASIAL